MAAPAAPRAVRVLELGDDGAPVHAGLLVIEVGTRLVFSARPNSRVDLVRGRRTQLTRREQGGRVRARVV